MSKKFNELMEKFRTNGTPKCSILLAHTGPLKTLAYAGRLDLLLKPGMPLLVTDMVLHELRAKETAGNAAALAFLNECLRNKCIEEYKTGVPEKNEIYRVLGQEPGDESIRICLRKLAAKDDDDCIFMLFEESFLVKNTFLPVNNVHFFELF